MEPIVAPKPGELKLIKELPDRKLRLVALLPEPDLSGIKRGANSHRRIPSIAQFARHFSAGKYSKGGIVKTQQGYVIDKGRIPYKLSEYFGAKSNRFHSSGLSLHANEERIRIINQLAKLGFRVVVPKYPDLGSTEPKRVYPKIRGIARTFTPKKPIRYGMSYEDDKYSGKHYLKKSQIPTNNYWARDIYKIVDGKRIRVVPNSTSFLGEGGLSVDIAQNVFFASPRLKEDRNVEKIIEKGGKVYFLEKEGNKYSPQLSRAFGAKVFEKGSHIDLFMGVIGKNLLVDPFFLADNRGIIRKAANENGLRLMMVPSSEVIFHPSNFLIIGENKVLVEKRAVKTMRALRKAGVEVVPTAVALKANLEYGGGVRCMVNEV
ncbi:MAG: hypothetical protein AABW59_03755 [archaeon]